MKGGSESILANTPGVAPPMKSCVCSLPGNEVGSRKLKAGAMVVSCSTPSTNRATSAGVLRGGGVSILFRLSQY